MESTSKGGDGKVKQKQEPKDDASMTQHSMVNRTKMASATVAHLSSCEGVLEFQNSLTPTGNSQVGQK